MEKDKQRGRERYLLQAIFILFLIASCDVAMGQISGPWHSSLYDYPLTESGMKLKGKVKSWTISNPGEGCRTITFNKKGEIETDTYRGGAQKVPGYIWVFELKKELEKSYSTNEKGEATTVFNKRSVFPGRGLTSCYPQNYFDESGRILIHKDSCSAREIYIDQQGGRSTYYTKSIILVSYRYNDHGNLKEVSYFQSESNTYQNIRRDNFKIKFFYDENQNMIERIFYSKASIPSHYNQYAFSRDYLDTVVHQAVDSSFSIEDYYPGYWGIEGRLIKMEYNSQGQKTGYRDYSKGYFKSIWEYDTEGRPQKETYFWFFEPRKIKEARRIIEFDYIGNVIKETVIDDKGKIDKIIDIKIVYHPSDGARFSDKGIVYYDETKEGKGFTGWSPIDSGKSSTKRLENQPSFLPPCLDRSANNNNLKKTIGSCSYFRMENGEKFTGRFRDSIINKNCKQELSLEAHFVDGLPDGRVTFYFTSKDPYIPYINSDYINVGDIKIIGEFEKGEMVGEWQYYGYFQKGLITSTRLVLFEKRHYEKGKKHIIQREYYLKKAGRFKTDDKGNINGVTEFYPSDNIPEYISRKETLIGYTRIKNVSGFLYEDISYYTDTIDSKKIKKIGKHIQSAGPIGHWKYFYLNGNLSSEGELSKGEKIGKWIYYYENGEKKSVIKYGKWKTYRKNGEKKYKPKFYKTSKLHSFWDENGKQTVRGGFGKVRKGTSSITYSNGKNRR